MILSLLFLKENTIKQLKNIMFLSHKQLICVILQNLSKSLRSNRSTIGTSDISCLISKNSIYSTLTKKFRRLCSTPLRNPIQEEESERKQCLANAERIDFLMHEAAKQFQAMLQTSKALNYCRLMKEFASGREQIEAEKILLVASKYRLFCYVFHY